MSMITLAELQAWAPNGATADATQLQRCIDAADQAIRTICSRDFAQTSYTETFDGDQADGRTGEIIRLPLARLPVTTINSITENGVTMSTATGYNTTANVIIRGLNQTKYPCELVRQPNSPPNLPQVVAPPTVGWAPGVQNVTVNYQAGYVTLPEDIRQVCFELAWLFWKDAQRAGVVSASGGGKSHSLLGDLTKMSKYTLQRYQPMPMGLL